MARRRRTKASIAVDLKPLGLMPVQSGDGTRRALYRCKACLSEFDLVAAALRHAHRCPARARAMAPREPVGALPPPPAVYQPQVLMQVRLCLDKCCTQCACVAAPAMLGILRLVYRTTAGTGVLLVIECNTLHLGLAGCLSSALGVSGDGVCGAYRWPPMS